MKIDEHYCKKFNLSIFVLESYVMAIGPKKIWKLGQDQTTENPNEFLHHTLFEQIEAWAKMNNVTLQPYDSPKPDQTDGRYITPKSRVNNLKVFVDEAFKIQHEAAIKIIEKYEKDFGKIRKSQKREFYLSLITGFTLVYCS